MGELLVLGPLNVVLSSLSVVVVRSLWSGIELSLPLLLDVQLGSGGLPPSVIVFEEHVVQAHWVGETWLHLGHVRWNI